MALGKLLKSLFGGGSDSNQEGGGAQEQAVEETEDYKGFTIEAAPIKEGGQYRTAGFISREVDGSTKRIPFIRADNSTDKAQSVSHSLSKAKQIVDEQGERLLQREML